MFFASVEQFWNVSGDDLVDASHSVSPSTGNEPVNGDGCGRIKRFRRDQACLNVPTEETVAE